MRRNDTTREPAWHRSTTMAMLAHAFLTVLATATNAAGPTTDEAGLIAVTPTEARRLLTTLLARTTATTEQILAWSRWRQRHQHRARTAHHQTAANPLARHFVTASAPRTADAVTEC